MRMNSCHTDKARGLDAYWTPKEAVLALTGIERLPKHIFDPACGNGAILNVLASKDFYVTGADIVDYGWPGTRVQDYLTAPSGGTAVVTNPPYKLAAAFVVKAVQETTYAAFLLRINFLESTRRLSFFRDHPISRIWVSSRRLPMMHRLGWAGPEASSNCAYCWFVWDRQSSDRNRVDWFDWKDFR